MKTTNLLPYLITLILLTYPLQAQQADTRKHFYRPHFALPDETQAPNREAALGQDLFIHTQKLRNQHVFNDLSCQNCHLDAGRLANSAPIWGIMNDSPSHFSKDNRKMNLSERIAACFSNSLNGIPPDENSDIMKAFIAYIKWQGQNTPQSGFLAGRSYAALKEAPLGYDMLLGQKVYAEKCVICHGVEGQGQKIGSTIVTPPLWGDHSYTWGSEMQRIDVAAAYIKANMPLGKRFSLSDQEAWDVAAYINSQERPQDPRTLQTGSAEKTAEQFHGKEKTFYLKEDIHGNILGKHQKYGERPIQ